MMGWYRATKSTQRGELASAPMAFSNVVEVVVIVFSFMCGKSSRVETTDIIRYSYAHVKIGKVVIGKLRVGIARGRGFW